MKKFLIPAFALLLFIIVSCKNESNVQEKVNTPVEQSVDNSVKDPKAVAIAQNVMTAMGGQQKWDDLKYVSWTFFGSRHLLWDKQNNRVRIKSPKDTTTYLVELDTGIGKKLSPGKIIHSRIDQKAIDRGKNIWINDMYWLFMPFKMMDPGVNLKYLRQDTTQAGVISEVVELTFNEVGNTPDNKYEVYIDQSDNLVKQWSFFKSASDEEPSAIWPWDNYKSYNGLLLSAERSDDKGPSNVKVYDTMDDKVFTDFEEYKFYE